MNPYGTTLGQARRAPCGSYAEALAKLAAVRKQREGRAYATVDAHPESR